jgi:hypothetical protein
MIANLLESRYDTALGIVKREYPELVGQIALVNRMRGAALREGQTGVDRVKAWHDHLYKR